MPVQYPARSATVTATIRRPEADLGFMRLNRDAMHAAKFGWSSVGFVRSAGRCGCYGQASRRISECRYKL